MPILVQPVLTAVMQISTFVLGLSLAIRTVADPLPPYRRFGPIRPGIDFESDFNSEPVFEYSRFEVPLDYSNSPAGKASLRVVRYNATVPTNERLGTLFINPGGPGASGVYFLTHNLQRLLASTSAKYDLVSWDPRGVVGTLPRVDCFASKDDEEKFWHNTIPRKGIEARGNFTRPEDEKEYADQVPEVDRLLKELGTRCRDFYPDVLQYVGTMATVRDMVALHDHLEGPDKRINYWGLSHGTIIGFYLANKFPDRVGRLILDGMVDPEYYAQRPPHLSWKASIDEAHVGLEGFLQECATAGPKACDFATEGANGKTLYDRVIDLINRAYENKKRYPRNETTSASVRSLLLELMYAPHDWPRLAQTLALYDKELPQASSRDTTKQRVFQPPNAESLSRIGDRSSHIVDYENTDYAYQAITCADAVDATGVTTQTVFDEILNNTWSKDHVFGPYWGAAGFYCHHWPVRAVERYAGPWNTTLDSRIILIGNKGDPATPLSSAKKVAEMYGKSAVLIEQEYGHTSLSRKSKCTSGYLNDYLTNGNLPKSSPVVCKANTDPFPVPSRPTAKSLAHTGHPLSLGSTFTCAAGLVLVYLVTSYVRRRGTKKTAHLLALGLTRDTEKRAESIGEKRDNCC